MGYTTDFMGQFNLDRPLDDETRTFLTKLAETRRMRRNLGPEYGTEGEFFVDGQGFRGQGRDDESILDYNSPPKTQPGLWCQWIPTDDGTALEWDGGEKFYKYTEWLQYIVDQILAPRGYVLNGEVEWQGEESGDRGRLVCENNVIIEHTGHWVYD